MIRKTGLLIGLFLISFAALFAKEGMWIPTLLDKYNIAEMQQMGFKLTAEDIYSVNKESMKDAVVLFGTGCTGNVISNDGLLITNHHCGFDAIQKHSSLENDYLTDGFWAKNRQEELPNSGLSVRFLDRMEDVSQSVLDGTEGIPKDSLSVIIARNTKKIIEDAAQKGKFDATIKPLFYGNQYFLYVYQVFEDVRLVGAPPTSIGKFGGDTDNWMWPRHTGDFSMFRIYAGKDNQPAKYSADNVPFKPKKFFKISLKGVKPEDFTLVFGFPGTTQQFLPSQANRQIMEQSDPDKIKIRGIKLSLLAADMEKDAKIRIQYAAKYQTSGNAWKKWQGEVNGLKRLNAVSVKQAEENEFANWVASNPERKRLYGNVLPTFEKLYFDIEPFTKANDYYAEIVGRGTDIFNIISFFDLIETSWSASTNHAVIQEAIKLKLEDHFKDYNSTTDEKVFAELLQLYFNDIAPQYFPEDFKSLMSKNSSEELISNIYRKSVFTDASKLKASTANLSERKLKKLSKDSVFKMFRSLKKHFEMNVEPYFNTIQKQIDENMKTYVAGIMAMNDGKPLWADANKTLRVAYGKVKGYEPMDGVVYNYYTTLEGIMQKDNPEIYDYNVPQALRDIYKNKDYGRYGKNGTMNVCFIASNHTTGGNSGSPVVNAEGKLIGLNFDRCWEGTMSDLMFDPERCRNIALDIRFALFVIDKMAGAGYLINEMVIE